MGEVIILYKDLQDNYESIKVNNIWVWKHKNRNSLYEAFQFNINGVEKVRLKRLAAA